MKIYRPADLHNTPARNDRPAKRGLFNVGKSTFYDEIEPDLEKVNLDYTDPNGAPGELYPAAIPPNKVGWDASKNCCTG